MADLNQNCTPVELLVEAMEKFSEDEPQQLAIIYTTEGGNIVWRSTTTHRCFTLGMLEIAKTCILAEVVGGK